MDTKESLRKWLDFTDLNIVLADNSGYDMSFLSDIQNEFSDRLEILSWQDNDYDRNLGKGYGELEIMKYFIKNSKKIIGQTHFIKVTGRYFIKNINSILSDLDIEEFDLAIHHNIEKNITHTIFFSMSIDLFKEKIGKEPNPVNDSSGFYFEHYFNGILHNYTKTKKIIDHLEIDGISGTFNIPLSSPI